MEARQTTPLNNAGVIDRVVNLPVVTYGAEMKKSELEKAVKWEAKKFTPMPIEEMVLDWKVLESGEKQGKKVEKGKAAVPGVIKTGDGKTIRVFFKLGSY